MLDFTKTISRMRLFGKFSEHSFLSRLFNTIRLQLRHTPQRLFEPSLPFIYPKTTVHVISVYPRIAAR
jgi:hypothetical protein